METKRKNSKILKKIFTVTVIMLLSCVLGAAFSASAYYEGDFSWDYGDDWDSVIITGYEGYGNEVIIPEEIDGMPVVGIDEGVFADYDITYVSIPDTVTEIGNSAFFNCFNLQRVDMSENIETVGNYAFSYCSALTDIQLPATVKTIGDGAFDSCEGLTSINIPDGVEYIGAWSFHSVPGMRKVVLPSTVKILGAYAFAYCRNLYSVTIPERVAMMYSTTFFGCISLNTINVAANNRYYKSIDGCLYSKDGTRLMRFPAGKNMTSFSVPSTIVKIEDGAFNATKYLTSVIVSNGVTTIGDSAFSESSKLSTVVIGSNVRSISDCAFDRCVNLSAINVNGANAVYKSVNGVLYSKDGTKLLCYPEGKKDTSFTMPDTVKSFYISNKYITNLNLSNKITSLTSSELYNCTKLTTVTIPKSVTEINNAFNSTGLKTVNYEGTMMNWYNIYITDSKVLNAKVNWKIVKAKSLKFKKKKVSLVCNGTSEYVQLITSPSDAACYTKLKSSNKKIVEVYSFYGDGAMLDAKALGKATITATNAGKKAKCTVYVKTANVSVLRKKSKSLKYLVKNIKGYKKAKWSTSNSKIATVSKSGTVKAKKAGTCKIYCKIGKTKYTINLKVNKPVSAKVLQVYDSGYYRKAQIQFSNNTSKKVSYITFNITQYNSKGKKIKGPYESYYMNGYIYAGGLYTGSCTVSDSTKKAKVTIKKVWFTDGSTWTP